MNEAYQSFSRTYEQFPDTTTKALIKEIFVKGYDDGYEKGLTDNKEAIARSKMYEEKAEEYAKLVMQDAKVDLNTPNELVVEFKKSTHYVKILKAIIEYINTKADEINLENPTEFQKGEENIMKQIKTIIEDNSNIGENKK